MKVLIVEDNLDLLANIVDYLTEKDIALECTSNGRSGLLLAQNNAFDVIVLDIGLPRIDGISICKQLRSSQSNDVPIIMITARDSLDDKQKGFSAGADDYLTKPFELAELEMRIKALTRRNRSSSETVYRVGDLEFDTRSMRIKRAEHVIELTPVGRKILAVLMRASPSVVTHAELVKAVWNDATLKADALKTHMYALRRAIDTEGASELIKTVHREGYRISDDE